jgi:uncharacterized membrane protein (UPF0127 family)
MIADGRTVPGLGPGRRARRRDVPGGVPPGRPVVRCPGRASGLGAIMCPVDGWCGARGGLRARRALAGAVGVLALLAACRASPRAAPEARLTILTDRGPVVLRVEVADTPEARRLGLMHRTSLPPDAGMVFLFERPTRARFWMKDTPIPLSIAFWDERRRIVAILDMEPCLADPCPLYDPGVPVVGAVEANRGFFERHEVEVGDRVELGDRVGPGDEGEPRG